MATNLVSSVTTVLAPPTVPQLTNEFAHLALVAEVAYQQSLAKLQAKGRTAVTLGVVLQAAMEATEAAAKAAAADAKRAVFVQVVRLLQTRPKNLIPPEVLTQLEGLAEGALQEVADLVARATKGLVRINVKSVFGALCGGCPSAQ